MRVIGKSTNVIIRPEKTEKRIGSIIIPSTVKENKYCWGTIESIGDAEFEVTVGDKVLYLVNGVAKINEESDDEVHVVPYHSLLFWRS